MSKVLLILSVFLLSCAYQVGNTRRSLPGGFKKIAVPTFKNASSEPGAETYFTNSMLAEMIRADFLNVVKQERADLVLEGSVIKISHDPQGTVTPSEKTELPDNTILNLNYKTSVIVEIRLRRVTDKRVVWSSVFTGEKTTPAAQIGGSDLNSSNPVYDYSAKNYSLRVLSKQVMEEAFTRMTEAF